MTELREEPADGPAARGLWEEYMELVKARLGESFEPERHIFATERDFAGTGAAWLVAYEGDRPVACGGMRSLAPGVAELKRMFVTRTWRRRGIGRALLGELERRAAAEGYQRVRLYTTGVLTEARALYESAGYRLVDSVRDPATGREDYWLEKEL